MIYRLMIALALLLWGVQIAQAKRVALVMGNSEYTTFTALPNPVNDARLMEKALKEVGFEVTLVLNADQAQMKKAMLDFGRKLRKGVDASIFYYAGHGVQVNGENYLIPTTANIEDEDEVSLQAVDVNEFLRTMESSKSAVNIVVLDACRNNPLNSSRSGGGGGLAPVNAPRGSYIAYATAPGAVAADGEGNNSPYTLALSSILVEPDLKLEDVFKKAREKVLDLTGDRQVPWETSSIIGDFFFKKSTLTSAKPSVDNMNSTDRRLDCKVVGSLKSGEYGELVTVTIVNNTKEKRKASWVDFKGQLVYYFTLEPHASQVQQTWSTHPWVFTDVYGTCVEAMLPSTASWTSVFEIKK